MHESPQDIARVQALLDASYRAAGAHLRSIHTEQRRLTAADLVQRLQGMRLLVLATVSAAGRPVTGPVDGVFHRGAFYIGTAPDAIRWRHLRRNPAVSLTHLPSEDWAVIVHGTAIPADVSRRDPEGLRATLLQVYTPQYGPQWETFLDSGPVYARIQAERMFALDVTAGTSQYSGDDHPPALPGRAKVPGRNASDPSCGGSAVTLLAADRRTSLDQSLREVMTAARLGSGAHAEAIRMKGQSASATGRHIMEHRGEDGRRRPRDLPVRDLPAAPARGGALSPPPSPSQSLHARSFSTIHAASPAGESVSP